MKFLFFLLIALLSIACGSDKKNLPLAKGQVGDLYVIMDSAQQKGPIGSLLDSILGSEMPGLPRKEPMFKIHWIDARRLNYILKERRNMIYVMTLDRRSQGAAIVRHLFTPESLTQIQTNSEQFMTTASDVFARGQQVMYLFSKDESTLAAKLRDKGASLVNFFDSKEREYLSHSLFKAGQVKGISEVLVKEFSCSVKFPFGYKLADKSNDFLWARQVNPRDDKDIFVARKPYTTQADFTLNNLIKFRDQVCRKYLFADPDQSDSYLVTETSIPFIPVTADTVNFNGHFAVQLRGLFKTNTPGLGGPFLGYAVVDEGTQQFYYIEGFTISPSRDQREIMRELETILHTFQTSQELVAQKQPAQ
jgi:hypothetical protein